MWSDTIKEGVKAVGEWLSRKKQAEDPEVIRLKIIRELDSQLDNEIKKPLFEDYQKKQHRRQLFLIAGLIYMFTGVFLYFLQKAHCLFDDIS